MRDIMVRQGGLAGLGLGVRAQKGRGEAGVVMAERPFRTILNLRGDVADKAFGDAIESVIGVGPPETPNTAAGKSGRTVLWLGPDEWWLVSTKPDVRLADRLRKALGDQHAAVTEVGEGRTCIEIAGPNARDVLAKACPLDLHPRVFSAGQCAQSHFAKAGGLIHQVSEEPAYDLYVLRSFAEYLWRWLEDAAQEYGVAVVERP